jgi:hypothetical protein
MMNAAVRWGALVAVLALAGACADSATPTAPAATPAATPAPPPISEFPAVSRPARIYLFAGELSYPVREYTTGSRYVLYEDGTFALQYLRSGEYRGTYAEANGLITFDWEGWSTAGQWGANGSLGDDSLTVRYNLVMEMSDFENAVYRRTQ